MTEAQPTDRATDFATPSEDIRKRMGPIWASSLTLRRKAVLHVIDGYARASTSGQCTETVGDIAKLASVCDMTVQRILRIGEAKGWLIVERRFGRGVRNAVRVQYDRLPVRSAK